MYRKWREIQECPSDLSGWRETDVCKDPEAEGGGQAGFDEERDQVQKKFFSERPTVFVMFKQFNITASKMFQNLMALHAVDPANQESISVEDMYEVTDALASLPSLHCPKASRKKQSSAQVGQESLADLEWPPQEEEFVVALEADGWLICCVISYDEAHKTITAHQL